MSEYQRKKYYFCQIKEDFFKKHPHDILVDMPYGREAMLLYIELLLESAGHDGHLMFSETKPFNAKLIAYKFHTPQEIVEKSLEMLKDLELLVYLDNDEIFLPDFTKYVDCRSNDSDRKRTERGQEEDKKRTGRGQREDRDKQKEDNVLNSIEYRDKSIEIRDKNKECVSLARTREAPSWDLVKAHVTSPMTPVRISVEFAKQWYDECVTIGWLDTRGQDIARTWKNKLLWAWKDEQSKQRERNGGKTDDEIAADKAAADRWADHLDKRGEYDE